MRNNLEYYQHDVNSHNHWKFRTLRRRLGWAGEGKFWALNNMIAASENCIIDLTNESKKNAIALDLDFEVDELDAFIDLLDKTCHLVMYVDGSITTQAVQEVFNTVERYRERKRDTKRKKVAGKKDKVAGNFNKVDGEDLKVDGENEQSKVKESKVKESKVKKKEREHAQHLDDNSQTQSRNHTSESREPNIPTVEQVCYQFNLRGGTTEMAEKFFLRHNSTAWYMRGSPIRNFVSLIPSFIDNYRKNDNGSPAQSIHPETIGKNRIEV